MSTPPKKTTATKTTAKKTTAKKTTATKTAAQPTATVNAPLSAARRIAGIRPNITPAAVTAVAAAAPSFLASLVEDIARLDLRSLDLRSLDLPTFDIPGFDVHKAVAEVSELPGLATEFVTDLAAAAAKRGSDVVSTVNYGVTLVREAVGV